MRIAKKYFEKQMASNYPGVAVKWSGGAPTLVVPDNLKSKQDEIVALAVIAGKECGVEFRFFPPTPSPSRPASRKSASPDRG